MLLALGILILVGLLVLSSELKNISNKLREIRDNQNDNLNALVRFGRDEPMQKTIEAMIDAGATLTDEKLDYRYGILIKIHAQLRSIARAVERESADS